MNHPEAGSTVRLLTLDEEARLFWRLRRKIAMTIVRQALGTSLLRTCFIILLSVVFWGSMLRLFLEMFRLLDYMIADPATKAETVHAVFNLFFLSLLAMLTLSSAIIFYSGMYRSPEVAYLLTTPLRRRAVTLYKYQETLIFSGWGFCLLGSPLLIAYGIVAHSLWYYYALLAPFLIAFTLIPVSCGTIACILVVRYLPAIRVRLVAGLVAAGVLVTGYGGWSLFHQAQHTDILTLDWFHEALSRLKYSEQRLLPSWWLSTGLLETAHPAATIEQLSWKESLGFLSVLTSNALLLYYLVGWCGRQFLLPGYSGLSSLANPKRNPRVGWMDRGAMWLTWPLPRPMQLLLIKDLRTLRRDPVQWTQLLIFFGLLAFYFANIRRFYYREVLSQWIVMVGFMNVTVIGLILATFTTRFIFPLISLEGNKFWILGTLPVHRDTILWSKFLFACGVSVIPCCALTLLSDLMLQVVQRWPHIAAVHQLTCLMLCLGLSGLAVGLGARLPNLREQSPAKIAAGFGGTLTLVLSTLFILVLVLLTAVPTYFSLDANLGSGIRLPTGNGPIGLAATRTAHLLATPQAYATGIGLTVVLGGLFTILPISTGLRAFRKWEV